MIQNADKARRKFQDQRQPGTVHTIIFEIHAYVAYHLKKKQHIFILLQIEF